MRKKRHKYGNVREWQFLIDSENTSARVFRVKVCELHYCSGVKLEVEHGQYRVVHVQVRTAARLLCQFDVLINCPRDGVVWSINSCKSLFGALAAHHGDTWRQSVTSSSRDELLTHLLTKKERRTRHCHAWVSLSLWANVWAWLPPGANLPVSIPS